MLATSLTAAVVGVDAHLVRVEADTASGFPKFTMLGLPDSSIKESEGRIRAALRNCGYDFKWDRRITVSMAPASLRKMGSSYDLALSITPGPAPPFRPVRTVAHRQLYDPHRPARQRAQSRPAFQRHELACAIQRSRRTRQRRSHAGFPRSQGVEFQSRDQRTCSRARTN